MKNLFRTEGFVFKKKHLLGADSLVILFTQDHGKVAAVAKGLRQFTSRRAPHLQSGNLIRVTVRISGGRYYIESTDLISGFLQLRKPHFLNSVYLMLAIIDSLLPEGQCEDEVFQVLKDFFRKLHRNIDQDEVMGGALQSILSILGYADEGKNLADLINLAEENIGAKLPLNVII